jgi:hypothetical protein
MEVNAAPESGGILWRRYRARCGARPYQDKHPRHYEGHPSNPYHPDPPPGLGSIDRIVHLDRIVRKVT